jgi:hypothetical protein
MFVRFKGPHEPVIPSESEPSRTSGGSGHGTPAPVSVLPPEMRGFSTVPAGHWRSSTGAASAVGASGPRALSVPSTGSTPWKAYHIPREDRQPLLKWVRRNGLDAPSGTPMTPEQKIALDHVAQRQQALMDGAVRDFPKREATMSRPTMPDIRPDASADEIIQQIYKHSNGLVVGEYHDDPITLAFLIDNMPSFAKQGVKTIYAEGFSADLEGAGLQHFFSSRHALMPESMKRAYPLGDTSMLSYKYSPTNLLYTARAYGITVIPVDSMASQIGWRGALRSNDLHPMHERQVMMNQYAQTVINARQSDPRAGKWLAWMGKAHVSRFEGVPGVAELTGAISLDVVSAPPGKPSLIQKVVHSDDAKSEASADSVETDYSLTMQMPES